MQIGQSVSWPVAGGASPARRASGNGVDLNTRALGLGADLGATRLRVGTGSAAYLQGLYGAKRPRTGPRVISLRPRTRSRLRENEPPSSRPQRLTDVRWQRRRA
jgi:hypothetical protein